MAANAEHQIEPSKSRVGLFGFLCYCGGSLRSSLLHYLVPWHVSVIVSTELLLTEQHIKCIANQWNISAESSHARHAGDSMSDQIRQFNNVGR
eukprot:1721324-Amphidinium_carterae.1